MSRSKLILVSLLLCVVAQKAMAQQMEKVWVIFKDKGIDVASFRPGDPIFDTIYKGLSRECIARRMRALGVTEPSEVVSLDDAPLNHGYLDSLTALGITPLVQSRWTNAVSAWITEPQCSRIKQLSFVDGLLPVARGLRPDPIAPGTYKARAKRPPELTGQLTAVLPDTLAGHYGGSQSQLERIGVLPMHSLGFDATGVRLGFLDTGFRWKLMSALQGRNVISEYDYVFHDSVTANQPEDSPGQDLHGSAVFSAATGLVIDTLVGPAYNATIMLAKTEDGRSETPREEDNYAAALESMESHGIEITTSSLGYLTFDSGFVSYTYNDLNGRTSICARAVQHATHLGLLCLNAMGNSGATGFPYMLSPADADSMLSVGALDVNDSIAGFSSRGPTSDGRIKPDICAPGVSVWMANADGGYFAANGTSYATPLTAGGCALIMQSHPEATAQQIIAAVHTTGVRLNRPDTAYGWGRLNAYGAAMQLGTIIGPPRIFAHDSVAQVRVGVAANNSVKRVTMFYGVGATAPVSQTLVFANDVDSLHYVAGLTGLPGNTVVRYYIEAIDGADTSTFLPRDRPQSYLSFVTGTGTSSVRSRAALIAPSLLITPNPAFCDATLNLAANPGGLVVVTDAKGVEVLRRPTVKGERSLSLPIAGLSAGVYLISLDSHAGVRIAETKLSIVK